MDQGVILRPGMDVHGSDGQKVGTIQEVFADYVIVEKGFFFPKDYYIPVSAIANADDDGNVYLSVTKDQALHQGWDTLPEVASASASTITSETAAYEDAAAAGAVGAGQRASAEVIAPEYTAAAEPGVSAGGESIRVPVHEEEIIPVKREVDRGAVRIEKELVTEERTVTVPVTEERIRVTRVATDAPVSGEAAFEEGVIEVPLHGEEVELEKVARQTGEVVVEKEAVQHTEQVGGTVRREEVRVDDQTVIADADAGAPRP
jgi:uncharacterized protein (TIGR02271 family)